MKRLIFSLALLFPLFCFSQKTDTIPFKNAEKVICKNNLSASENFKLVKNILQDEEIEIASQDKDVLQIKTGNISFGVTLLPAANYNMIFFCKDSLISIKSFYKSGISTGLFTTVEESYIQVLFYKPNKKNVPFDKMVKLAKKMKGIVYYGSETTK